MNRRLLNILMIAFVVAGGCSFLVYRLVSARMSSSRHSATTSVMAASRDVKLGYILTAKDVTEVEIAGGLPNGAITKMQDAVGRGVMSDLYQGEPIVEKRLAPKGAGGGLAAMISQGMRACAVKVDEVVGVAGFVLPGMRVDVLISGDPPGPPNQSRGTLVRTLLQNIQVLSAGSDIQKDVEGKPQQVHVVNLLVTPEQAEALSLASNQSHIQLVLRNPLDNETAKVTGSAMSDLYGQPSTPTLTAAAPSPVVRPVVAQKQEEHGFAVEVLNGGARTKQQFTNPQVSQ